MSNTTPDLRSEIEETIGKNVGYIIRNIDDSVKAQSIIDGMLDQILSLIAAHDKGVEKEVLKPKTSQAILTDLLELVTDNSSITYDNCIIKSEFIKSLRIYCGVKENE